MQLIGLVNQLLATDRSAALRPSAPSLAIAQYAVVPLSPNSGLIGWVVHCDTLHALIREYREARKILLNIEHRLMLQLAPNYELCTLMQKVETFTHALESTNGQDLQRVRRNAAAKPPPSNPQSHPLLAMYGSRDGEARSSHCMALLLIPPARAPTAAPRRCAQVLWLKSSSSEAWLDRRSTYTRSLAVMSMVGYVLGLGDRHPSNLMLHRVTGAVLHIDFGDCFEVRAEFLRVCPRRKGACCSSPCSHLAWAPWRAALAACLALLPRLCPRLLLQVAMQRDKYPERIPFRLTRMLTSAMEVGAIDGHFRATCVGAMSVLRRHKDSVMAMLEAFVHDPLVNWYARTALPN